MSAIAPRTTRPASGRGSRRRRALAMVAMAILAAALCIPRPAATSASWNGGESARAGFSAITVPTPSGLTCQPNSVLGIFVSMTLTWNDVGPGFTYQVGETSNVNGAYSPVADAPIVDNGNGTWSATLDTGLLGGLLGSLLGTTSYYSVRALKGWAGPWGARATLKLSTVLGALGPGSCTVAN